MKKLSGITLMVLAMSAPVYAKSVTVVGSVLQPGVSQIAGNTGSIASSTATTASNTTSINAIIQQNLGGGVGYMNKSQAEIIQKLEANGKIMQQLADLNSENMQFLQQSLQADSIRRSLDLKAQLIDTCITSTAVRKRGQAQKEQGAVAAKVESSGSSRSSSTENVSAATSRAAQQHEIFFCSADEKEMGRCEEVTEYPGADIKASTLLNGAIKMDSEVEVVRNSRGEVIAATATVTPKSDEPTKRLTFNEDTNLAAQGFINNAMDPVPDKAAPKESKDLEGYNEHRAMFLARQSRLNIARLPANKMMAESQPTLPLDKWATHIESTTGNAHEDLGKKTAVDGKISEREFMEFEALKRRYENVEWYKNLSEKSNHELNVEAREMQALQVAMQYKQMQLLENIALILGADLAHDLSPITKEQVELSIPKVK